MADYQVPVTSLSLQFSSSNFSFDSTAELVSLSEPIGQHRALEALKFATEINSIGYNIYCMGDSGIGKHEIVQKFLEQKASLRDVPSDWIYVNNFVAAEKPIAISLASGQGKIFQQHLNQFIEDLRTSIPSIYESERFRNQRDSLIKDFKDRQDRALSDVQERAKSEFVYLVTVRGGFLFVQGEKNGNLMDDEALELLPEEEQKKISERLGRYNDELSAVINQFPILERQLRAKLKEFSREMISGTVETLMKDLREKYSSDLKISEYLQKLSQDIIENSKIFRRTSEEHLEVLENMRLSLRRYEINVLIDHADKKTVPIIYEDNPTFMNLVGQIEHLSHMGALMTDFTLIKAGSLHRANGGYLIIDAHKLLGSPYAWEGLKRSLKSELISIESLGQVYSLISTLSLKPEPIPLNCKVILIGDRQIYQLLMEYDPEFSTLFKISADFENRLERTKDNEHLFMRLLGTLAHENGLLPLDNYGAVKVLKHAVRLAEDNERISVNVELISNILKESHFYAGEGRKAIIGATEVQRAIDTQRRRVSLGYEKIIEETLRGTLFVDLSGVIAGQINGLSVFEFGKHLFGRASRITAVVRMGDGNVIDIEREIKMGGPIHSKGVLILSGFLKSHYAQDVPLSISASLVFEQSYGPIDGDSASLAELCALLSALSGVGIRQAFAVTGSVNQHGEVQPVGAINEKIEGFFDLCRRKGLSGEHGVIIPRSNLKHLSLRDDVIEQIKLNKFMIYAVDTVDECLQILTGIPKLEMTEKIETRLHLYSERLKSAKIAKGDSAGDAKAEGASLDETQK